jgi:hypothetical protein
MHKAVLMLENARKTIHKICTYAFFTLYVEFHVAHMKAKFWETCPHHQKKKKV